MQSGNEVEDLLAQELEALRLDIVARMRSANQIATGRTAKSLRWTAAGESGQLIGAAWLPAMEKGRAPWKRGPEDPEFVQRLVEWIKARGFQFDTPEQLLRFAKFLKWKINKSGNKLYRAGGRRDVYTPAFEAFAERLRARAGERIKIVLLRELE